jgi:hypothetical protein
VIRVTERSYSVIEDAHRVLMHVPASKSHRDQHSSCRESAAVRRTSGSFASLVPGR